MRSTLRRDRRGGCVWTELYSAGPIHLQACRSRCSRSSRLEPRGFAPHGRLGPQVVLKPRLTLAQHTLCCSDRFGPVPVSFWLRLSTLPLGPWGLAYSKAAPFSVAPPHPKPDRRKPLFRQFCLILLPLHMLCRSLIFGFLADTHRIGPMPHHPLKLQPFSPQSMVLERSLAMQCNISISFESD